LIPDELHVLLIGIDAYDGGGSLRGCVNDVDAVQSVLLDRLGVPAGRITRLVSPRSGASHDTRVASRIPTLAAITGELDRLADVVAPHERVLVHFAGHGTQVVLTDDAGRRFPREGLLPKDKVRGPDTVFLADWELNAALARIGARCLSATVVLDCCNSAGVTRAPDRGTGTTRYWPTAGVHVAPRARALLDAGRRGVAEGLVARIDNCQVVAACQANEKAMEDDLDGRTMGHLTRSLCERLGAVDPRELSRLRWGRIWRQVEATVVARNPQQRPWLSAGFGRRVFGGDPHDGSDVGFAVVRAGDGYQLDVGTLAGVTHGARIAVYGPEPATFPPLGTLADRAARRGELRVRSATRTGAVAVPVGPVAFPEAARARLVAPGADARITVWLEVAADPTAVAALTASPFVQLTGDARHADLRLHHRPRGWVLADDVFGDGAGRPCFPTVPHGCPDLLRAVVEHYYRYRAPLRLASACRDLPTLLGVSLLDCDQRLLTPAEAQTAALPEVAGSDHARYEVAEHARIAIAVHNDAERDLYVTLFDAAPSGRVIPLGAAQIPARARERFWSTSVLGTPFCAQLPHGQAVGVDRIVAIGTTVPGVDLGHLRQDVEFADLLRRDRGSRSRTAEPAPRPPAEQYTAASADLWIRR